MGARHTDGPHPATTSLHALAQAMTEAPLRFRLELVSESGSFTPAGHVMLTQIRDAPDDEQPTFDPVLHRPPEMALRPARLAWVRAGAYSGSRQGRGGAEGARTQGAVG